MSKLNMPSRIESGETTVKDKWTILQIILCVALGSCLIGGALVWLLK